MKRAQHFFFLSSIPRSGSTLLGAILNQNPSLFVTPTSPLLDLLNHSEMAWKQITQAKTWADPQQKINTSRGIMRSIYEHIPRPMIIDKHRGWIKNISALQMILGYPPKILFTVRDLAEVVSSYMILVNRARENGQPNFIDDRLRAQNLAPTNYNSTQVIVETVSEHFQDLRFALEKFPDCVHLIEYRDLMAEPDRVIDRLYGFLGLAPFFHEFDNIKPIIEEDDTFWGLQGLHSIRPQLKRVSPHPAEIVGEQAFESIRALRAEFWREVAPRPLSF